MTNALIMDSGSPHCPEPDLVVGNVLRDGSLAIPEWIVRVLMIYSSHDLNTRTSVVLNRINWCMSHLLTCGVVLLHNHPRQLSLTSNGVGAKSANTQAGMIGVGG